MTKQLVGFIFATRHGKFKPVIGHAIESEGDDDSFISIIGEQNPQDTLEQAQAFLIAESALDQKFLKPIRSSRDQMLWLNWIIQQQETDVQAQ